MKSSLIFEQLKKAFFNNRLGHAMLFIDSGKNESFKKERFQFLQTLSCREPQKTLSGSFEACGKCESCKLYEYDVSALPPHPDLFALQPEGDFSYSVEQIRNLMERMSLARSLSPYRIVLLENAEALSGGSGAAANAFLKILEEPRPYTFLILCTAKPSNVMATLRSRCQSFRFSTTQDSSETSLEELNALGFAELVQWLRQGASSSRQFRCPLDLESFWKKRPESLETVMSLSEKLWTLAKDSFDSLEASQQLAVLDFFTAFDSFLGKLRFHTQGHLQWLELRNAAKHPSSFAHV